MDILVHCIDFTTKFPHTLSAKPTGDIIVWQRTEWGDNIKPLKNNVIDNVVYCDMYDGKGDVAIYFNKIVQSDIEITTAYDTFGRAVAEFESPAQPPKQSIIRCTYCGCKVDTSETHCKSCGAPLP